MSGFKQLQMQGYATVSGGASGALRKRVIFDTMN
jgi:hypothetical protein